MERVLKEYQFADMGVRYLLNDQRQVGLMLYPVSLPVPEKNLEHSLMENMVQIKILGDCYNGCYAQGNTLRNGETTERFLYDSQTIQEENGESTVCTVLKDERGYEIRHYLRYRTGEKVFRIFCEFENHAAEAVTLELFASCSLQRISPYLEGAGEKQLMVHRLQSRWSQEGQLLSQRIEDLQLDTCWNFDSVRCERFGQVGSLPVNHYFPFLAIEDCRNHVFWGMQLAHNASWQMEIYRKDENLSFSGGLADREFGHWMKRVKQDEIFCTPEAIVSVAKEHSLDRFTERLTEAGIAAVEAGPKCEQDLPIIFNEYCTTWGDPSHEKISRILDKIKGHGFEYFVIDCGWYKQEGVPWDTSMGDYKVSPVLFPDGMEQTTKAIREAGMQPGIWFEIENIGKDAEAFQEEEHLLKLDGYTLTNTRRRFWDMNDPWVEAYLTEHVIGTLKKYGFSYMKMDYNDTIGIGCDGYESPGEGLRRNMEAAKRFVEKVKKEIPDIVLENCASGGHRLEPGYMALTSMASFSDAHEAAEIPIIAANVQRAILPRQSQIWAVLRQNDSLKRIVYSVAATFLGRMCISGDVCELDKAQWEALERGIQFYKKAVPIIKIGHSYRYGSDVVSMRDPEGWQAVVRLGEEETAMIVLHTFHKNVPETLQLELPIERTYRIDTIYSYEKKNISVEGNHLRVDGINEDEGIAVLIKIL